MKPLAFALIASLALSGCTSIIATRDYPRPMAGIRCYLSEGSGEHPGFSPSFSFLAFLEAPLTFLLDVALLPYTATRDEPEDEEMPR